MANVTRTDLGTVTQATATTHAFTPVTIPAGSLAVVRAVIPSDTVTFSSVTDSAGNTWNIALQAHSASGDANGGMIAYSVITNAISAGTVTVNLSATNAFGGHLAYFVSDTGWLAQASVLDKTSSFYVPNQAAWTSGSTATTTQADELLVGLGTHSSFNGSASTPGGSWAEECDFALTAGNRLTSVWQKVTATGTYAATGTWAAAEIGHCFIATFMTAAGSTTPGPQLFQPLIPMLSKFHPRLFLRLGYLQFPDVAVPSGVTYQPTGSLAAGTVASGADSYEASETGSLTTRALSSGADVAEHAETGSTTAGTIASGPDSFQPSETGSLTAGTISSGADVFTASETGTTPVGTLLSGVSAYVPAGPATYNKAGSVTAGTLVSGADSFQPVEAGSLTTRALVSGADVFTAAETGTTPVGTLLSGADATTHAETGTTPVGTILSGVSVKIASGIYIKTGSLVAQTLVTGIDASTLNRTGSLTARALFSGVAAVTGAPTEGFGGPFDSDTEHGRTRERDAGRTSVGVSGRSRVSGLLGRLTSVQKGKIDSP